VISQIIWYCNEYFLHLIIKPAYCLTPGRNIIFKHRHIARILNSTDRNSVLYPEPISLTQKHIKLAQNLPGSKLVDLRQYAYTLIIDWHAMFQSRKHALQCSNKLLLIHLCFSACLSSETNTVIEKIDFIHWLPFARAPHWNRTLGMPRCSRSSWMSYFSINVSWKMLNSIVCKQKSISLTVFEKWELEKSCVRSVIQCTYETHQYCTCP